MNLRYLATEPIHELTNTLKLEIIKILDKQISREEFHCRHSVDYLPKIPVKDAIMIEILTNMLNIKNVDASQCFDFIKCKSQVIDTIATAR